MPCQVKIQLCFVKLVIFSICIKSFIKVTKIVILLRNYVIFVSLDTVSRWKSKSLKFYLMRNCIKWFFLHFYTFWGFITLKTISCINIAIICLSITKICITITILMGKQILKYIKKLDFFNDKPVEIWCQLIQFRIKKIFESGYEK